MQGYNHRFNFTQSEKTYGTIENGDFIIVYNYILAKRVTFNGVDMCVDKAHITIKKGQFDKDYGNISMDKLNKGNFSFLR